MQFDEILKLCAETAYPEPVSQLHSQIIPWAVDEVCKRLKPSDSVLDVGCGAGVAAQIFREKGMRVMCVSILQDEVDKLREDGFHANRSDMHDLSGNALYNCVFARHVLEHSPCPYYVIHILKEHLVTGGLLYVEVPAPDTECHHERNPNHWSVLTSSSWSQLLIRAGFSVTAASMKFKTGMGDDEYLCFICTKPTK